MVEPPIAMSKAKASSIASLVTISRGLICFLTKFIKCLADSRTNSRRSSETARTVPFPGKAKPNISNKQFIEFAVNIPAQEPQVGQAFCSMNKKSFSVICPSLYAPTASNIEDSVV